MQEAGKEKNEEKDFLFMKRQHPCISLFHFCPRCGGRSLKPGSEKSLLCKECGLEYFFNPAAAVGVFLTDKQGKLLFVRRSRNPAKGKLGLPGGFVDAFERAEEAAVRELQEETSLRLSPSALSYLCSQTNSYSYHEVEYRSMDLYFTATLADASGAKAMDECSKILFLDPFAISPEEIAFDSLKKALMVFNDIKKT